MKLSASVSDVGFAVVVIESSKGYVL